MAFQISGLDFKHPDLENNGAILRDRIDRLRFTDRPRFQRLWDYYRNPLLPMTIGFEDQSSQRPYRQAQEWGLPARITGIVQGQSTLRLAECARKEVVIENDIAWRIDAMVDWLFGSPITVHSTVENESRRTQIDSLINQVISANGGIGFLQKLALLGAIYGFVDVLVKLDDEQMVDRAPTSDACESIRADSSDHGGTEQIAQKIRFEIVEPGRSLPLVCPLDPASAVAFVQVIDLKRQNTSSTVSMLQRLLGRTIDRNDETGLVEIITDRQWQRYENGKLIAQGSNSLGRLPLVHIQNVAVPFSYAGASDVEPLLPLQDELNTRLSDRAYRITMQSFKMYLGKGIDDFINMPVSPGRMWATDNEQAEIIEFGGDAHAPSEEKHIDELREALDKTSGVSPIAAGAIKNRIGRLTSAAALRVTMQSLLARTQRKRTTYGSALAQLVDLSLAWLDKTGDFSTLPNERRIEITWPDPIADAELSSKSAAQFDVETIQPKEV